MERSISCDWSTYTHIPYTRCCTTPPPLTLNFQTFRTVYYFDIKYENYQIYLQVYTIQAFQCHHWHNLQYQRKVRNLWPLLYLFPKIMLFMGLWCLKGLFLNSSFFFSKGENVAVFSLQNSLNKCICLTLNGISQSGNLIWKLRTIV